jgi:DNA-binding NarL/FixJ family response regulator
VSAPLRLVIADDHPLFREGLRTVLSRQSGFFLLGEARDGEEAFKLASDLTPDVLVTDLDMPGMNGLELARRIQGEGIPVDVIVLTMYREEDMFNEAMDLGVRGYVLKENAVQDIVGAIHAVAEGRYYISPSLSDHLITRSTRARTLLARKPDLESLTPMERRVLKLISEEKQTREIAGILNISPKTAENHRTNISSKLGLRGSNSLLKFAIANRRVL